MILQETLMWIVEAISKTCSLSEKVLCHCYVWCVCAHQTWEYLFLLVVQ